MKPHFFCWTPRIGNLVALWPFVNTFTQKEAVQCLVFFGFIFLIWQRYFRVKSSFLAEKRMWQPSFRTYEGCSIAVILIISISIIILNSIASHINLNKTFSYCHTKFSTIGTVTFPIKIFIFYRFFWITYTLMWRH